MSVAAAAAATVSARAFAALQGGQKCLHDGIQFREDHPSGVAGRGNRGGCSRQRGRSRGGHGVARADRQLLSSLIFFGGLLTLLELRSSRKVEGRSPGDRRYAPLRGAAQPGMGQRPENGGCRGQKLRQLAMACLRVEARSSRASRLILRQISILGTHDATPTSSNFRPESSARHSHARAKSLHCLP